MGVVSALGVSSGTEKSTGNDIIVRPMVDGAGVPSCARQWFGDMQISVGFTPVTEQDSPPFEHRKSNKQQKEDSEVLLLVHFPHYFESPC